MSDTKKPKTIFQNAESPFTELFYLFQQQTLVAGSKLGKKALIQHIDNATEGLLQGLQSLGQLIGRLQNDKVVSSDLMSIGFFITLVSNLIEFLGAMRHHLQ